MAKVAVPKKLTLKRDKSRSTAQVDAERHMITAFGHEIGVELQKKKVKIEECTVEIDGFGQGGDGTIHMVEAWAHIGKAIGAQPKKVLTDVLKLAFTADSLRLLDPNVVIKTYILFADSTAGEVLRDGKWGAKAARHLKVTSKIIAIPDNLRDLITQAQKDQDVRDQASNSN